MEQVINIVWIAFYSIFFSNGERSHYILENISLKLLSRMYWMNWIRKHRCCWKFWLEAPFNKFGFASEMLIFFRNSIDYGSLTLSSNYKKLDFTVNRRPAIDDMTLWALSRGSWTALLWEVIDTKSFWKLRFTGASPSQWCFVSSKVFE